jgi:hypothetical protein
MAHNRLVSRAALWIALASALMVIGASCTHRSDEASVAGASPNPSPTTVSGTSSASASATDGAVAAACSGGWKVPKTGTELATFPIQVIKEMSHHAGSFKVVELRYFVGVESPPSPDKPYLQDIERWYVKLYDPQDPAFRGRFLVERRPFGSGVAAVAPFDTHGYSSPDWQGLTYESSDLRPKQYPTLPGTWSGSTYDFVTGGDGINVPGLPPEEAGCLGGT